MKAPLISIVLAAPVAVPGFSQSSPEQEPLVRVQPIPAQERASDDDVFSKEFDPDVWLERLTKADLDAREKSYADLLRRARIDPGARAFLEKLSKDETKSELAWTARLALRELGHAQFPLFGFMRDGLGMEDPMQRMLQEFLEETPSLPYAFPRHLRKNITPLVPPPGASSSERSVQVQQTAEGAKIVITATIDGKESRREFEGKDLEQILEQNPELSEELHLSVQGIPDGFRFQWKDGTPWQELLDPFQYGDVREQISRLFSEKGGAFSDPRELDPLFAPTQKSQALRTDVLGVVVSSLPPGRAKDLGVPSGLMVQSVGRGSIAALLHIRAGDVLVELNGRPLSRAQDITEELAARPKDGALSVVWIDEMGQRNSKTWRPEGSK